MKVVFVNVKYSSNLGEGVLAECLENGLKARIDGLEIRNCDLDARENYGEANAFLRFIAQTVLPKTPEKIKSDVYRPALEAMVRRKLLPYYEKQMEDADVVIFGGEQLLSDANLNYPMKVAAAASVAREKEKPIAIHSVGVGRLWSEVGAMLFKEAFAGCDPIWASVCDSQSQKRWRRHFIGSDIDDPDINYDTRLLAKKTYGPVNGDARSLRNRPLIGLCVTSPKTLLQNIDGEDDEFELNELFYRDCVKALAEKGMEVMLFSNGAPQDEAFMEKCFPRSIRNSFEPEQVVLTGNSKNPGELVDKIRKCDGIIAHRAQANIIAYSYSIPHVGLSSGRSVDEFFNLTGRSEFLLNTSKAAGDTVAEAMQRALEKPIAGDRQRTLIDKVDKDLDELAGILKAAHKNGSLNGGSPAEQN